MKTYNGIVELTIGPLAGKTEVEIVKQKAAELPQTMHAFRVQVVKCVKIWTCFTRPDGTLPQTTEEAEVFQAHAYRLGHQMLSASTSLQHSIERAETGTILTS